MLPKVNTDVFDYTKSNKSTTQVTLCIGAGNTTHIHDPPFLNLAHLCLDPLR